MCSFVKEVKLQHVPTTILDSGTTRNGQSKRKQEDCRCDAQYHRLQVACVCLYVYCFKKKKNILYEYIEI